MYRLPYWKDILFVGWFAIGMAWVSTGLITESSQAALDQQAKDVLSPVSLRNEWGHLPPDNPRPPKYIEWHDLLTDEQFDRRDAYLDGD